MHIEVKLRQGKKQPYKALIVNGEYQGMYSHLLKDETIIKCYNNAQRAKVYRGK